VSARRLLLILIALALSALAGRAAGPTLAAFSATTVNPSTMSAKTVFPGVRAWSGWDLDDASSGAVQDRSDPLAFTGSYVVTGNWSTSWSTSRHLTFDMSSPLPAGLAAGGVAFEFDFADDRNNPGNQVCFYFEVLRRSTGAVIGTHGSPSIPVACEESTAILPTSTALPEVSSSDIADDLRIRVYAMHTNTARAMRVDRAVVSGSTAAAPFTLYETSYTDAADGTPATTPWSIATADASALLSASNWPTAFSASRYLRVTFPAYLPASATVTSAQLVHVWRPQTAGSTACFYFDVLSGATVIATYGSAAAPYCATGSAYTTTTVPTPALNTAARVNGAIVRMYVRNSGGGRTQHDQIRLDVGYGVD
jgi:hypothetical protein